eukprot:15365640-Ditylum_brightwellii.AAC.1
MGMQTNIPPHKPMNLEPQHPPFLTNDFTAQQMMFSHRHTENYTAPSNWPHQHHSHSATLKIPSISSQRSVLPSLCLLQPNITSILCHSG